MMLATQNSYSSSSSMDYEPAKACLMDLPNACPMDFTGLICIRRWYITDKHVYNSDSESGNNEAAQLVEETQVEETQVEETQIENVVLEEH